MRFGVFVLVHELAEFFSSFAHFMYGDPPCATRMGLVYLFVIRMLVLLMRLLLSNRTGKSNRKGEGGCPGRYMYR